MFPPLHPLLLGLLGGSRGIAATHAFTATCLLAALVAAGTVMYVWTAEPNERIVLPAGDAEDGRLAFQVRGQDIEYVLNELY